MSALGGPMRLIPLLLVPALAQAAAPLVLSHQGRLLNPDGNPYDGSQSIRITLYDTEVQADPGLWTKLYPTVDVQNGYYAVTLVQDDGNQPLDLADFE